MDELERHNELQQFLVSASPDSWMSYADELKFSADLLWEHEPEDRTVCITLSEGNVPLPEKIDKPGVSRTFILLVGLSIENILKGLAVASDPTLVNTGKLAKRLKIHGLLDLVGLIPNLALSPQENELCKILQEAIPYWGRYPVPRRFEDLRSEAIADAEFKATYDTLYGRLHRDLYTMIRDGWDSKAGFVLGYLRHGKYEPDKMSDPNEPIIWSPPAGWLPRG